MSSIQRVFFSFTDLSTARATTVVPPLPLEKWRHLIHLGTFCGCTFPILGRDILTLARCNPALID